MTWKANITATDTQFGPLVEVDTLYRNGTPNSDTWRLRWDNGPNQWAPSTPAAQVRPYQQVTGTITTIDDHQLSIFVSPRLVTPDGACTIYLAPFLDTAGQNSHGARVAVLGDELLAQLNDSNFNNQGNWQGYVEGNLNALGIRTEVEGDGPLPGGVVVPRGGWIDDGNTSNLDRADTSLADEFRGLLEQDPDGFVVALGTADARYIATGDRQARTTEIFAKLDSLWRDDLRNRTNCMAVVTTPENESSIDPDYGWAALQVNNYFRWYSAFYGPNDSLEVVDFATEAQGKPWFQADNVHLNAAGTQAYTAAISRAARRCSDEVVYYGSAESFQGSPLSSETRLPTGHLVREQAVSGWQSLPGKSWLFPTVLDDGTILSANVGHLANPFIYTGNTMAITAFQPATNDFYTIQLATDTGSLTRTGLGGQPLGFEVGDVKAIDANTVAFTGASLYTDIDETIQPNSAEGMFPVFGVLTKGANGRWQVAAQWSPPQLYADASDPALGDAMCPLMWPRAAPTIRDCNSVQQIDVLPQSKDLVVTQYFGRISVLRLTKTPSGGYDLDIRESWQFPTIPDPNSTPGDPLVILPLEVSVDPTSAPNDERFAVKSDFGPVGLIEFSYNAGAASNRIQPVSPPIYLNKTADASGIETVGGASLPMYDKDGNLWIPGGGSLWVYAKGPNGRRLSNGSCMPPGFTNPLDPNITVTLATPPGPPRKQFGVVCRPDYEILQGRQINHFLVAVEHDPRTGNIVSLDRFGGMYVVDPEGTGDNMTFSVSNAVNVPTTAMADTTKNIQVFPAGIDATGRAWAVVWHIDTSAGADPMQTLEQWLFSVDTTRLRGRQAHQLTASAGKSTLVQAERTQTTTTAKRAGQQALTDVASATTAGTCFDYAPWIAPCAASSSTLTGGYALSRDDRFGGVPAGTVAKYRVVVPKSGGSYSITYRASDLADSPNLGANLVTDEQIQIREVGGQTFSATTVTNLCCMHDVAGPTITLTPGTHELEVFAPAGHHDWQLDWIKFTRQ